MAVIAYTLRDIRLTSPGLRTMLRVMLIAVAKCAALIHNFFQIGSSNVGISHPSGTGFISIPFENSTGSSLLSTTFTISLFRSTLTFTISTSGCIPRRAFNSSYVMRQRALFFVLFIVYPSTPSSFDNSIINPHVNCDNPIHPEKYIHKYMGHPHFIYLAPYPFIRAPPLLTSHHVEPKNAFRRNVRYVMIRSGRDDDRQLTMRNPYSPEKIQIFYGSTTSYI